MITETRLEVVNYLKPSRVDIRGVDKVPASLDELVENLESLRLVAVPRVVSRVGECHRAQA